MKYIDLHCDALTKTEGVFQVSHELLAAGGCLLQCFAAFSEKPDFCGTVALCEKFDGMCEREGYRRVRSPSDLDGDGIHALLTVEGGGALEGSLDRLDALYRRGVRLLTLVWNDPNELGWPNFVNYRKRSFGYGCHRERETQHGLTRFGREVTARMRELGMLIDVSHGSDKLFFEVAEDSRKTGIPFVASHSGAAAVYPHARNLTDGQIRTLADCGGAVGLVFCADFLSDGKSAADQHAAILAHAGHILDMGGPDVLALGSDFDGIPPNPYLGNAAEMPRLLEEFTARFGFATAEKIAFRNAQRVLTEILR